VKPLVVGLIVLIVIAASAVSASFFWWNRQLLPLRPGSSESLVFVVTPNQTATEISQQLAQKGLIRSDLAARIYLRMNRLDQKIRPGAFQLSPSQDLRSLFVSLTSGPKDIWVTIPEGWRREQIAARLQSALAGFSGSFNFTEFITSTATMEGQLFPDTYLIPADADTDRIISIFNSNFIRKSKLTLPRDREVLILASLIEREAKSDPDRAIIGGILRKRLEAGWPLQIDATVQYAADTAKCSTRPLECDWWQPVTDTKFNSPYNTYLSTNLPPGPIANPGLAAITGAVQPQNSSYWYYLTGLDGKMYYAQTLAEHNLNIDNHLRP